MTAKLKLVPRPSDFLPVVSHDGKRIADLDFEGYSEAGYLLVDGEWKASVPKKGGLKGVGGSEYNRHSSSKILIARYDLNDGRGLQKWHEGDPPPKDLMDHVSNGGIVRAFNSMHEYRAWNFQAVPKCGWVPLPIEQTMDVMAGAAYFSLPLSLESCADALKTKHRKDKMGDELMKVFSWPSKNFRPFESGETTSEMFSEYCAQDVRVQQDIARKVGLLPPNEHQVWLVDQKINELGMKVDRPLLKKFMDILALVDDHYKPELVFLTYGAIDTGFQTDRMKKFALQHGVELPNLQAETVVEFLKDKSLPQPVKRLLELRQILAKSSVLKIYALLAWSETDGRARGLLQYGGATRTIRWAGRGPQPQNLPRSNYELAEAIVKAVLAAGTAQEGFDAILRIHDNPVDAIAQCLRACFIADEGFRLMAGDYKQIEAVVLAVLAGETRVVEAFRRGDDLYEIVAAAMTGVSLEEQKAYKKKHKDKHPVRIRGKYATLASGYGGSVGAWINFGALDFYNSEEEILEDVNKWRSAHPMICKFWKEVEKRAKAAIQNPRHVFEYRGLKFGMQGRYLCITLLSGRKIRYLDPSIKINRKKSDFGPSIHYWAMDSGDHGTHEPTYELKELDTYGGKLVENIVQATARDILAHALVNLWVRGYRIVMHVHDEIVCEMRNGEGSSDEMSDIMMILPSWAKGWPIRVDKEESWEGHRYRK